VGDTPNWFPGFPHAWRLPAINRLISARGAGCAGGAGCRGAAVPGGAGSPGMRSPWLSRPRLRVDYPVLGVSELSMAVSAGVPAVVRGSAACSLRSWCGNRPSELGRFMRRRA